MTRNDNPNRIYQFAPTNQTDGTILGDDEIFGRMVAYGGYAICESDYNSFVLIDKLTGGKTETLTDILKESIKKETNPKEK